MEWPYPRRIPVGPLMNYGYEDAVLLITPVHAARQPPSGAARIGASLKWVVCQELCIAGKGNLSLEVPVASGAPAPSRFHEFFVKTRKLLPRPASAEWKLKAVSLPDALVLNGRSHQPVASLKGILVTGGRAYEVAAPVVAGAR